jgi:hypothetical protein
LILDCCFSVKQQKLLPAGWGTDETAKLVVKNQNLFQGAPSLLGQFFEAQSRKFTNKFFQTPERFITPIIKSIDELIVWMFSLLLFGRIHASSPFGKLLK